MRQLITELRRLYLLDGQLCRDTAADGLGLPPIDPVLLSNSALEQHLLGLKTLSVELRPASARGRVVVVDFAASASASGEQQWTNLCLLANGVRDELELPAPAVSISGRGFQLWLSLETPTPLELIDAFVSLLLRRYLGEGAGGTDGAARAQSRPGHGQLLATAELPPCRLSGGKWAAFIHPGMGASFADEPALEMAPPVGAQVGFLEGLHSIGAAQFDAALAQLRAQCGAPPPPVPGLAAATDAAVADVLLKDASLEQIVRALHARHIEPTFRHLLPPR